MRVRLFFYFYRTLVSLLTKFKVFKPSLLIDSSFRNMLNYFQTIALFHAMVKEKRRKKELYS